MVLSFQIPPNFLYFLQYLPLQNFLSHFRHVPTLEHYFSLLVVIAYVHYHPHHSRLPLSIYGVQRVPSSSARLASWQSKHAPMLLKRMFLQWHGQLQVRCIEITSLK